MAKMKFTAEAVEEKKDFEVVPQGNHQMMITTTEFKKADSGAEGLNIVYKIVSGPFEHRLVFDYINLKTKAGDKNEIGYSQLSQICAAIGIESFADTEEMHDSIFTGTVKHSSWEGQVQARVSYWNKPKEITATASANGAEEAPF